MNSDNTHDTDRFIDPIEMISFSRSFRYKFSRQHDNVWVAKKRAVVKNACIIFGIVILWMLVAISWWMSPLSVGVIIFSTGMAVLFTVAIPISMPHTATVCVDEKSNRMTLQIMRFMCENSYWQINLNESFIIIDLAEEGAGALRFLNSLLRIDPKYYIAIKDSELCILIANNISDKPLNSYIATLPCGLQDLEIKSRAAL